MKKGILARLDEYISGYRLITVFLAVYLFLQPFKAFTSVREIAFALLASALSIRLINGQVRLDIKERTTQAFILLIAVCAASALLSPYPMDSLIAVRKNLFYQAVVFFAVTSEHKEFNGIKPLIYALIGGFALLSLAVVAANKPSVLLNWLDNKNAPFLSGYSTFAAFYIPLAAAFVLSSKEEVRIKWVIAFVIALGFALSALNNHRTQTAAIAVSTVAVALIAKRYKILAAGAALGATIILFIFIMKPASMERYQTLLKPGNFVSNDSAGWNDRWSVWSGVYDMASDRPVLGWGYGWKKIADAAKDGGYLERWPEDGRTRLYFTRFGYGAANPHNLLLQIVFEAGVLGLGAFLFFWVTIISKAISVFRWSNGRGLPPSAGVDFLKFAVPSVLLSYFMINVTNGLWEEVYGVLMTAFAAICVVVYREAAGARTYRKVWVYEPGKD
ncbi:MAG: O-antigen ligase family protein [Deltaproteobacteria bacterium]|nr:O-antigen ligase family protein [Deltaproteobacteria bacterium]